MDHAATANVGEAMDGLRQLVRDALNNAVENVDDDYWTQDDEDIAYDLCENDADLEMYDEDELIPYIREWRKDNDK